MAYTETDPRYKIRVLFSFADHCGAHHSRTRFSEAFRNPLSFVSLPHSTLSDMDGVLKLAAGLPLLLSPFFHSLATVFSGGMALPYFIRQARSYLFQ